MASPTLIKPLRCMRACETFRFISAGDEVFSSSSERDAVAARTLPRHISSDASVYSTKHCWSFRHFVPSNARTRFSRASDATVHSLRAVRNSATRRQISLLSVTGRSPLDPPPSARLNTSSTELSKRTTSLAKTWPAISCEAFALSCAVTAVSAVSETELPVVSETFFPSSFSPSSSSSESEKNAPSISAAASPASAAPVPPPTPSQVSDSSSLLSSSASSAICPSAFFLFSSANRVAASFVSSTPSHVATPSRASTHRSTKLANVGRCSCVPSVKSSTVSSARALC
mmetsp:Transcript_1491/g.5651  ORF Transcript_1491/g.5651 Transcript_1491/m.5651 type:complete len:287 (+) Transcript_1491:142-1002(+)